MLFRLPWQEALRGPDQQVASPILGTLLDTACGGAVLGCIPEQDFVATLDMRVDNYGPIPAGKDLMASSCCERLNTDVAYAVAIAWLDGQPDQLIARATASFMRTGSYANPVTELMGAASA